MFFSHYVAQKTGRLEKTSFFSHFENMENQNLGQILLECFFEKSGFFNWFFLDNVSLFSKAHKLLKKGGKHFTIGMCERVTRTVTQRISGTLR